MTAILVTKGAVEIEIEDCNYHVGSGQLALIGAHQVHAARPASPAGWQMRSLHLPPHLLAVENTLLADPGETVAFSNPIIPAFAPAALLFLDLHHSLEVEQSELGQADQFRSLIAWFCHNIESFKPQVRPQRPPDLQLEHARNLIAQTVFENTLLESIAEEVGLSVYALIRRFKKYFRISPHAWRMQMRASAAAWLLREKVSLADVAGSCGFADQAHMSRIFKKVYGVTPGQYGLMR